MPETGAEAALELVTAMHRALIETEFELKNGLRLKVSASVGLATAPSDGTTVHAIIGTADSRMYEVKIDGKGKVKGA
jgi:diguanylate cyclase (GGDEF)-like protein